jgi:hypothetical protein
MSKNKISTELIIIIADGYVVSDRRAYNNLRIYVHGCICNLYCLMWLLKTDEGIDYPKTGSETSVGQLADGG